MPKRPPQPYAAAPPTASVSASRSAPTGNDDASWDETKQIIRDLIAEYSTSDVAQTAKDCLTLNAMLEDKQREVVAAADAQIDALHDQIRAANEACGAATDDLRAHSDHIAQMEADGFGGCTNHGECEASCPKGISVDWIARMNADFLKAMAREPDTVDQR